MSATTVASANTSLTMTERVIAANGGFAHCFACSDPAGPLVARRRRDDGGAIKVGRWTYGLYHQHCEQREDLRP